MNEPPTLSRLKDDLDTDIRDLDTRKVDRPMLNRTVQDGSGASIQVKVGEIVETNSAVNNVLITLPPVLPATVGLSCFVVRRSAANVVTVGLDVLPASTGMWEFKQAATAWWRVGA